MGVETVNVMMKLSILIGFTIAMKVICKLDQYFKLKKYGNSYRKLEN